MTHSIALVNMIDGTVQGHKAGCADLKTRIRKQAEGQAWVLEVSSKAEARAEYNADFDEEAEGWYDIDWKPCANEVPAEDEVAPVVEVPKVKVITSKVGAKWTYLYADGELIAELRNDQKDAIAFFLGRITD